ncbi:hypothetical protein BXZ70DRAFT_1006713 [Cristinia sonorae]|uniref:Uncharacterized protein n=1 Tax=Cristinia sonorae TaxID=1940300 RepID=A0A8K0XRP5_9AGAR|nr:hypothetical protein BXZ70DRAFT_1006713 [Cristinia sonorae]
MCSWYLSLTGLTKHEHIGNVPLVSDFVFSLLADSTDPARAISREADYGYFSDGSVPEGEEINLKPLLIARLKRIFARSSNKSTTDYSQDQTSRQRQFLSPISFLWFTTTKMAVYPELLDDGDKASQETPSITRADVTSNHKGIGAVSVFTGTELHDLSWLWTFSRMVLRMHVPLYRGKGVHHRTPEGYNLFDNARYDVGQNWHRSRLSTAIVHVLDINSGPPPHNLADDLKVKLPNIESVHYTRFAVSIYDAGDYLPLPVLKVDWGQAGGKV